MNIKPTYDQLKEKARPLDALIENLRTPMMLFDKGGTLLMTNKSTAEYLGGMPEDLIGRSVSDLFPEDWEKSIQRFSEVFNSGSSAAYEDLIRFPMGERWFISSYIPIFDENHAAYAVQIVSIDITDKKKAEDALRSSQEQLQILFDHMLNAFAFHKIITDPSGAPIDYVFLEVNKSFENMTGLRKKDIIGKRITEIYPDIADMDFDWIGSYGRVALSGEPIQLEQYFEPLKKCYLIDAYCPQKGYFAVTFEDITERKITEKTLKETEEIFNRFMEHSPIHVFFKDEEIRSLRLSRNYEQLLGVPLDSLLGKTMDELFPSDLAKGMIADDKRVLKEGKLITAEEELNGRFYETIKFPILIEGKPRYLAGYTTEITERKLAQKALRESEEKFRTLMDQAADMLLLYDMEGNILEVNQKAIDEYGYSKEDLLSMNIADLEPDYSAREKGVAFGERLEMNKPRRFEAGQKRKEGTVFPVEVSVTKFMIADQARVMALYRDISEQKRTKETLESNIKFLETLLNTIPSPIFYIDSKGRYLGGNRAYTDGIIGMKKEEMIGRTIYELPRQIMREIADTIYKQDMELMNTGGTHVYEAEVPCSDNKNRDFIFYKSTFSNAEGEIAGMVGVMLDITERKRGEEEKTVLQQRLQQAQKMESIGTLAGGIAHDFNNILFPILAYSELTAMGLPSDSPLQHNIKQIYKSAERARDLVQQILTFARRQEKERIPIKISQILKETLIFLRSSIPSTIDIRYDIKQQIQDTVLADPTRINQIIMNLSTNAAHAMEERGGLLELTLANEEIGPALDSPFSALEPGWYLKLSVRDTGHGIDPQIMNKIFEPYFTTKERGKGTGMGLAIVHGIVKSYGGDITVDSDVGNGTIFNVYLPLTETEPGGLAVSKNHVQYPAGIERVLIVDDEKDAVDVLHMMLETLGYKVTSRTSSVEALEAFRHNPDGFDLVITDQTMPNMTGKNLARELMSVRPGVPIILCTGYSEQIDEKKAREMGIRAFVMKPIVMGQIADIIREVLDKK